MVRRAGAARTWPFSWAGESTDRARATSVPNSAMVQRDSVGAMLTNITLSHTLSRWVGGVTSGLTGVTSVAPGMCGTELISEGAGGVSYTFPLMVSHCGLA